MGGQKSLRRYDNSQIWALFLFCNLFLFYLAPVKIYFDNNVVVGIAVKSLFIVIIVLLSIRNYALLVKVPFLVVVLLVSIYNGASDVRIILGVSMPVLLALALYRVNIDQLIVGLFNVVSFFWIFYGVVFVVFHDYMISFDQYEAVRVIGGESYKVNRSAIGFISPNNVGLFLSFSAVLAFSANKYTASIVYNLFAIISSIYTDSRSSVILALVVMLFVILNKKRYSVNINKIAFFLLLGIMFAIVLLAIFRGVSRVGELDLLLSHRLYYTELIFVPSLFGTPNQHALDMGMIDVLNKVGFIPFFFIVMIVYKVMKIGERQYVFVLYLLVASMAENLFNQYHFVFSLIVLYYLQSTDSRKKSVLINHHKAAV